MKPLLYLQNVAVVLATCLRVKSAEKIEGLFYYDIRSNDECQMTPYSIEESVWTNHLGTIATTKPLPLKYGYMELNKKEAIQLLQVI